MIDYMNKLSQIVIDENDLDIPITGEPDSTTIDTVVNVIFGVAASVALLVIVVAGIRFILSRGDPQKTTTARNTIIYTGVGLVIAVLAFSIVKFVVGLL